MVEERGEIETRIGESVGSKRTQRYIYIYIYIKEASWSRE